MRRFFKKFALLGVLSTSCLLASCTFSEPEKEDEPIIVVTEYDVTIAKTQHGTLSVDKNKGELNQLVTVTAVPEDGFYLSSLLLNDNELEFENNKATFAIVQGANVLSAVFSLYIAEGEGLISFKTFDDYSGTRIESMSKDQLELKNTDVSNVSLTSVRVGADKKSVNVATGADTGKITFTFKSDVIVSHLKIYGSSGNVIYPNSSMYVKINDYTFNKEFSSEKSAFYEFDLGNNMKTRSITLGCNYGHTVNIGSIILCYAEKETIPVISLKKVSNSNIFVKTGDWKNIKSYFHISPSDATEQGIVYTFDDDNVEFYGDEVLVKKSGDYSGTAKTINGGFEVSFTITALDNLVNPDTRQIYDEDFKYTFYDLSTFGGYYSTPSKGNTKILVVPVEFSDINAKWNSDRLTSLSKAFVGDRADGSNSYWESLKSYYYKSSYGNINLDITIADVLIPSMKAYGTDSFTAIYSNYANETITLINQEYKNIKVGGQAVHNNISEYDNNNDGYIDGIWFIYNQFDSSKVNSSNFWAYVYWMTSYNVKISAYANMAGSFLLECGSCDYDSHVLCHETGHLLGLSDYYDSDSYKYGYLGALDMMDNNIGDHNAYSKFVLGWTNPYVLNDFNKESIEVELKPFAETGDTLIIPSNSFDGTVFGEYLTLEYYTPTGVNYLDANNYYSNGLKTYSIPGIKVLHADSRLLKYDSSKLEYAEPYTEYKRSGSYSYLLGAGNGSNGKYTGLPEISLISKQNDIIYDHRNGYNGDLFVVGDELSARYQSNYFANDSFYDGSYFGYNILVKSMTNEKVVLEITKA